MSQKTAGVFMILTLCVCVCMRASVCVHVCLCVCICLCVCVRVRVKSKKWTGFVYLTKLQLHYSLKKKTPKHSYQKDCMSHFMSYHPYFVHFKKHCMSVPPQQFQIDIFIPGSEIVELSVVVFGVVFSSPKWNRSKWYHIWCPTCSRLLHPLSSSNLSLHLLVS